MHTTRGISAIRMTRSARGFTRACAVNRPHSVEEWLALIVEFGQMNFRCMELLDEANTGNIRYAAADKGADRHQKSRSSWFRVMIWPILRSCSSRRRGRGINIYTHSEMLPAHGYPGLKKYIHSLWVTSARRGRASSASSRTSRPHPVHDELPDAAAAELSGPCVHHIGGRL